MVTPTQVPAPASSTKPYIVFGQPRISDEEIEGVAQVLKSGWIGTGPRSIEFEKAFARYQDSPHALAVGSCTAALYLALKAYGIGPGDEVITSAMTFAATVNAILHVGAKPIVVDIEKNTLKIDLKKTAAAITPRTRAILPVHFAGEAVDMDELQRLGRQYGVRIIHDCAHAIETRWKGRTIPSYGDVACYSFYSTKNITTIEGGMLCSGDEVFIHRARLLSNHGLSKDAWKRFSVSGYQHYDIVEPGFKFNFTDVQAALGLAQLAKIGSHYEKRSAVWTRYQREFAELPFRCPNEMSREHLHARHLYPILIDEARCGIDRDTFLIRLHALGIGCGVHYRAIPQMSAFQKLLGLDLKDFPNAVRVGNTTLSLPLTPYLSEADVTRVIEAVKEVLSEGASLKRAA